MPSSSDPRPESAASAEAEKAGPTPGPWITTDRNRDPGCIVIHTSDGFSIASAWKLLGPNGEPPDDWPMEANARLIAAAPDLLAALEGLLAEDAQQALDILIEPEAFSTEAWTEADILIMQREAAARAAIAAAKGNQ